MDNNILEGLGLAYVFHSSYHVVCTIVLAVATIAVNFCNTFVVLHIYNKHLET